MPEGNHTYKARDFFLVKDIKTCNQLLLWILKDDDTLSVLPAGVSDFASPHSPPPWGSAAVFSPFHHPKILFPSFTNISDSRHRSLFTLECSGEPGGSGWCPRAVPAAVQVWRGAVCRELRAAGAAQGLWEGAQGSAPCPGPSTGLSLGLSSQGVFTALRTPSHLGQLHSVPGIQIQFHSGLW